MCVLLVMVIFCFTVWIVMLLAKKGSWIWLHLIKSVDVVINTRILCIWYFECGLAVRYIIQEDSWWKTSSMKTKDKRVRVLPYTLNYWKWGYWTVVFHKSNILFSYYSFSHIPLNLWHTINVNLYFWKDFKYLITKKDISWCLCFL